MVEIEVTHKEKMTIGDNTARSFIERMLSLYEECFDMSEDDIAAEFKSIGSDLMSTLKLPRSLT